MYELPSPNGQRQRHVDPCPLSGSELGVLQRLAEGKVYKQIAHELTLSTSTVRTHLHNIYGKLGAVDRAQAVPDRHGARLAVGVTTRAHGEGAMISITSKSPYAVLALTELARSGGPEPVPIGELARRRDVPVQFLEQLFAVLRRAGMLSSQRGVKGGYRFAREPSSGHGAGGRGAARRTARPRRAGRVRRRRRRGPQVLGGRRSPT